MTVLVYARLSIYRTTDTRVVCLADTRHNSMAESCVIRKFGKNKDLPLPHLFVCTREVTFQVCSSV